MFQLFDILGKYNLHLQSYMHAYMLSCIGL